MSGLRTHRPPATCPVCSDSLIILRLGCPSCGTELSGHFSACRFCRLDAADSAILEVFLRSRGNVRDVQAHLAVSYPTARARLIEVLDRLGLGGLDRAEPVEPSAAPEPGRPAQPQGAPATPGSGPDASAGPGRIAAILADLAAGEIDVARAEALLAESDLPLPR